MKTNRWIFVVLLFLLGSIPVQAQSDFYTSLRVPEVRIYFQERNWDAILDSLHEYVGEDGRLAGDVMIDGRMFYDVGVRYKGYSSFDPSVRKSPFNIDLEYHHNNQNYQGFSKLKLSNVIQDPSFVREVLTYEIARKYVPASRANFANVYVNDTLMGLYTNVEAVDKNFMEDRFHSRNNSFFKGAPDHLIIPDGQNANLYYYDGDTTSYKPFYKLESDDSERSWCDLLHFIDVLNNDTAALASVLNVDRALWMHAINYTLVNLDSYIGYSQNYYLYMDDNFRFNPVVWDFNMSFGSFKETDGISSPPGGLSILKRKALDPLKMLTTAPQSPRPLIVNLLHNDTYRKMFLAHMRTIVEENILNGEFYTRGTELQNLIDVYVQADSNKFYPYDQFRMNLDTTVGSGNNVFPGLRDFMEGRVGFLDSLTGYSGSPVYGTVTHTPEHPDWGAPVSVTAGVSGADEVWLYYRYQTDGIFQRILMADDGAHEDGNAGDSIYGAAVTCLGNTIQYYVWAENDSAGRFSPERAEYDFYRIQPRFQPGDIVLNEVMLLNNGVITDADHEADPWIELCNTTGEDQSLGSLRLTENPLAVTQWSFPDTVLAADDYLIVWPDQDVTQDGLHAELDLPVDEGRLFLTDASNRIIDSVCYGLQLNGRSYGRYPNASGPFVYMEPSAARENLVGTTPSEGLRVFPNPAGEYVYVEMQQPETVRTCQLLNACGKTIISNTMSSTSGADSGVFRLNIAGLCNGLYIVKVETNVRVYSRKILIIQ